MSRDLYHAAIIGAGPAGTGPIVCALQQGRLATLLDAGVALIERGASIGRGAIGDYAINSDTLSDTFLEPFKHPASALIGHVAVTPEAEEIRTHAGGPAPLRKAGAFMSSLGAALRDQIATYPNSAVLSNTDAQYAERHSDGTFSVHVIARGEQGSSHSNVVRARNIVFAMGGAQSWQRIQHMPILGRLRLRDVASKTVLSHAVLSAGNADLIRRHLGEVRSPRVLVIGGSHSALSAANVLLAQPWLSIDEGAITIAHRNRLRLYYPSAEAATADGYTDFGPDDICPLTKRLYRLAGFRFDSRELLMCIWGIGGREREKRVALYDLEQNTDVAAFEGLIARADLIVAALGYRPNTLPIYDSTGEAIPLRADQPGTEPMVNRQCELLRADGAPLPNAFGIGLASGFVPDGDLGGEPSFRGQTNGLWLYQNGVGQIILDRLLDSVAAPAHSRI
jgi:hypothetical protein